jgi:hypothetical protein
VDSLTNTYGDWKTADAKVQARANELGVTLDEAAAMARKSPKAFLELFVPKGTTSNAASSGGTGVTGQRSAPVTGTNVRDKAFYTNLRKTDPRKYWSVDVQAQMRRDLFS